MVDSLRSFCLQGLISEDKTSEDSAQSVKSFEGTHKTEWFFGCTGKEGALKSAEAMALKVCRDNGYRNCRLEQEGYLKQTYSSTCYVSATAIGFGSL